MANSWFGGFNMDLTNKPGKSLNKSYRRQTRP